MPKDHDGKGVVCPACALLLRIPGPEDVDVPLITARQQPDDGVKKDKRFSRNREVAELVEWDRGPAVKPTPGGGRKWLIVAAVGVSLLAGALAIGIGLFVRVPETSATAAQPETEIQEKTTVPEMPLDLNQLITEADAAARKFLDAKDVAAMLPLVRNPADIRAKAEKWYEQQPPEGGPGELIEQSGIVLDNGYVRFLVRTAAGEDKPMFFERTRGGLKIDWETWAGWAAMPWREFIAKRPQTPVEFRVAVHPTNYYNYGFSDDSKWQSFRLDSADGTEWIYGYAPRGSAAALRLQRIEADSSLPCILLLRFSADETSEKQVIIDNLVTVGWVAPAKTR
ncbi:MAG: hypothetical protein V4733_04160 [Verrucomicrobiota bacterium]